MINVAIVGLGPRGLSVLDRVLAYARRGDVRADLTVHLFDTHPFGVGCHDPNQPSHLMINTVAGQITQFSDESLTEGPVLLGPSFSEWLEAVQETNISGAALQTQLPNSDGYYPRALLGSYLHWVFTYLIAHRPANVKVVLHDGVAVDDIVKSGDGWILKSSEVRCLADFVFLTTGHSAKTFSAIERELSEAVARSKKINPKADVVFDPYPIRRTLAGVTREHTIAIEGMGLTAFDLLAELTVGRGGRFSHTAEGLRYHASGDEPKILLFSRSGLPLSARAVNQKGISGQYKAKFLTLARVETMRRETVGGKLNFRNQILPWLLLDMQYAFYFGYLKNTRGLPTALQFCNDFMVVKHDKRQTLIDRYVPAADQFSWERIVDPIPDSALDNPSCLAAWLIEHLEKDLADALMGNINSPIKAACDVLRDLRDVLRFAIDFGGLEEGSHRWLLSHFMPLMNRLAVGPPKERIEELLALIKCGIVSAGFGPQTSCTFVPDQGKFVVRAGAFESFSEYADVLIRARIALPGPAEDQSPLMRNLVQRGVVRPFLNGQFQPGGIEINRDMNVINNSGQTLPNLWALGTLVEGCKFYTFVLARPYVNSTALVDASRAVGRMVSIIQSNTHYKLVA